MLAVLGNQNVDKEIKNLQGNKKNCLSRDHYIIRKMIVFSLFYATTQNFILSAIITLIFIIFNYKTDHLQCLLDSIEDSIDNLM